MVAWIVLGIFTLAKIAPMDQGNADDKEPIQILPVSPTPESNTVILAVNSPKNGEVKTRNPVWIQFRLDGYPLGTNPTFDRANELAVSKKGQTVHVIIDDNPYIAVDEQPLDPFNEDGWYYDTTYKFEVPYALKNGMHVIRIFPARAFGEGLKGENAFQVTTFYIGSKEIGPEINLKKPFLTYNEPGGQIPLRAGQPVLLDFYVSNCELSSDGYKVLVTIDGKIKRTLVSWQPYYIYGLPAGKHTIRLQLMDPQGKQVSGPFNDVSRTIVVQD